MGKVRFIDCIELVGNSCKQFDGTKKYISTGAVSGSAINESKVELVDYETKPSRANLVVESGDILFAKMQATEKTLPIDGVLSENIYSTGFFAVKAKEKLLSNRCLYYLLTSSSFLTQKDENCSGATQKAINNAGLAKITINIPDISEQQKLVQELDAVSELITLRRQQIEQLDMLVQSRFYEMFGDPKANPHSYDIVSFADCIEYMGDIGSNGANQVVVDHLDMKDDEDYALMVRFLNFTKNDFTKDVKYISKEAYDFFKKSQIFGGELIICKIGSAGQNYIMPYLNRPVSLGLNQIMVRVNSKIEMLYLYQYLHTQYGEILIDGCINGAVTKSITKTELKKIPVMLPPKNEQMKFVSFVEEISRLKNEIMVGLTTLEELKKSLMQRYFG